MNEKNKKWTLPMITFFVIVGIVHFTYQNGNYHNFKEFLPTSLNFYYQIQQPGFFLTFFLFITYIAVQLYPIDLFRYQKNKFQNNIIIRISKKNTF